LAIKAKNSAALTKPAGPGHSRANEIHLRSFTVSDGIVLTAALQLRRLSQLKIDSAKW
jgi:hypothetical protein